MPNYAVHDGAIVRNVIVANTQEIAEQVTGLQAIETTGVPWIGWTRHGDEWRPPMPQPGVWEWDHESHSWIDVTPPEEEPADDPVDE